MGVARLKDSPDSEARMIAVCANCRLRVDGGQSSIASYIAAVFTTS